MADSAQRPGWYPDPDGVPGERWWNGVDWSDTSRGRDAQPSFVPSAAPLPAHSAPGARPTAFAPSTQLPVPPPLPPVNPYGAGRPANGGLNASVNQPAVAGFIVSVIGFFFNAFVIPSVVAIVLSWRGMALGRQLRAQGNPANQYGIALAGFVLGIVGAVSGIFFAGIYLLALSGI